MTDVWRAAQKALDNARVAPGPGYRTLIAEETAQRVESERQLAAVVAKNSRAKRAAAARAAARKLR